MVRLQKENDAIKEEKVFRFPCSHFCSRSNKFLKLWKKWKCSEGSFAAGGVSTLAAEWNEPLLWKVIKFFGISSWWLWWWAWVGEIVDNKGRVASPKRMEGGSTVLWREDNFVFGQIWKFRFMYTFGIYWSFGIFYPTFDEQQSRFRVQSSQKIDIKNRKNEKMPKNSQFWTCFGVFE